ncbi:MAG: hypothetical protein KJO49_03620 [Bacteroidia bacterium]|nr:hypothetical protein [Bacteroidia bacterium]NNK70718.1 hypothetical protein [Flavobacteriaceae bacterium]NNL79968.1 hypothetical protein [Flavobacteriaceae bacterium]
MNTKSTLFFLAFLLLSVSFGFAQKNKGPVNIITGKVHIAKYHSYDELNDMTKGDLLKLYSERIKVIVNILPNIAFATKPGITMEAIGIPVTKDNVKALQENREASVNYFDSTIEFQKKILPYSDTSDLIAAIIFYEETLKSLHTYNDYRTD